MGAYAKGGVVWVSGRIRQEHLAVLLGTKDLPIVMSSEPLARSILHKAHREDHRRSPKDVTARARRLAWIPGSTRSAKKTVGECYHCRLGDRKTAKQLMWLLPPERISPLAPFEALALDLFGPFPVKDAARGK